MDPHEQVRTEMTLAAHRRIRQRGRGWVCAACGQSWPCGEFESVAGRSDRWTLGEVMRAAALLIVFGGVVPFALSRVVPIGPSMALLVIAPPVLIVVGWAVLRRRRD